MVRALVLMVCLVLLAAACSSDGGNGDSASESTEGTVEESAPETPSPTTTTTTAAPTTTAATPPTTAATVEPEPTATLEPAVWIDFPGAAASDRGRIGTIDVNPDGTAWAMTELEVEVDGVGFVLSRFEGDEWVPHPGPVITSDRPFQGFWGPIGPYLAAGPDGSAWVLDVRFTDAEDGTMTHELWEFDGEDWILHSGTQAMTIDRGGLVESIDVGGDGIPWITTTAIVEGPIIMEQPLVMRFDGDGWTELAGPPTGDCDGLCRTVHVDADGEVWVFTADGVARLEASNWAQFDRDPEFSRSSGWATMNELGVVSDDWTMFSILGQEMREGDTAFPLTTQTYDGAAWATWPGVELSPEWLEAAARAQAFPRSLAAIGDEHLFVGLDAGLIWFRADGVVQTLEKGTDFGAITALASSPDGSLWIARDQGITRFDPSL